MNNPKALRYDLLETQQANKIYFENVNSTRRRPLQIYDIIITVSLFLLNMALQVFSNGFYLNIILGCYVLCRLTSNMKSFSINYYVLNKVNLSTLTNHCQQ